MDIFDLSAKLSLDSGNYEKGLSDAQKSTSSFASKLKSGLATAGKVGAAAIGAVTTAAGLLTKTIVDGTKEVAAYGDTIDKQSQKMGLSAQAYQEWDAILKHSGASIDSLKGGMKTLNSSFADALSVISATTEADAELEAQLESGAISLDEYNQKYDELYDGAYDSIGALSKLGFSMQEIEEMSNDSDKALSAVISRLQEMPEGAERTALAQDLLGKSAMELGALLNTSAEDTEKMRQRVHELGGVMSDEAVKAAAAYQDSLQDFQTSMQGVKRSLITDFMPSVTTVMDGLTNIFAGDSDSGLAQINEGISKFAENISNVVTKAVPIVSGLVDALGTALIDNADTIIDAGLNLGIKLMDGIVTALPKLAKVAVRIVKTVAQGLSRNIRPMLKAVSEAIVEVIKILTEPQTIKEIIAAGVELIMALVGGLLDAIPVLLSAIPEIINNLIDALLSPDATRQIINAATQLIEMLVKGIIVCLPQLIEAALQITIALTEALLNPETNLLLIKSGFDILLAVIKGVISAIPQLVKMAPEIIKSLKDSIVKAATSLYESAIKMLDEIKRGLKDSWPVVKQWGKDLIDKIWAGIVDSWSYVKAWAGMIFGKIKEGASNAWNSVKNIGKDIVEGVWEGIKSMANWLGNKVSGFFDGIVADIKGSLGIHSPSKVFAEIGRYSAEGFGVGFDKAFDDVAKDVQAEMGLAVKDVNINGNGSMLGTMRKVEDLLVQIRDKDTTIVLDDGTLVGRVDRMLGQTALRKARGNA